MKRQFVTPRQIIEETQMSRSTVYKWIRNGTIPGGYDFAPGVNAGLRVDRVAYEAWRDSCKITFPGRKMEEKPCTRESNHQKTTE